MASTTAAKFSKDGMSRLNDGGCSSNRGKETDYQHSPPVEDAGSYPSSLLGGVYRRQTPGQSMVTW
jgi:hypothetical protein